VSIERNFAIAQILILRSSEAVSIPTNPRTTRPVGYAFVDLSTPTEAERAISELNGQSILERKVSIQLARKPEAQAEGPASGNEGTSGNEQRSRTSQRGRGRARGRGGRGGRATRTVSHS
jgi:RNA recognition motif-containing protein